MPDAGLLQQVVIVLERGGVSVEAMGVAWARALPTVVIVPAFGLRAVPAPARMMMAFALAVAIGPSIGVPVPEGQSWMEALVRALISGLPVALSAAVPLWIATMAGGVIDSVRGANSTLDVPVVEGRPTLMGVPLALLASLAFLTTGGPARVAGALARNASLVDWSLARAATELASGIEIAVAVAAPVLAASVVVEVAAALMARAASPAPLYEMLAPLRSFAVLAVAAMALDRMAALVSTLAQSRP